MKTYWDTDKKEKVSLTFWDMSIHYIRTHRHAIVFIETLDIIRTLKRNNGASQAYPNRTH